MKTQESDPTSLLKIYKKLISIRKSEMALKRGSQRLLFRSNDRILAYLRIYEDSEILILLNFSAEETRFYSGGEKLRSERAKVLFSTHRKEDSYFDLNIISLLPYEGNILRLE